MSGSWVVLLLRGDYNLLSPTGHLWRRRHVLCDSALSYFVRLRTLHGRCHRVEDLEGGADVGTNSRDVLLLAAHVAVLRTTRLWRQDTHTNTLWLLEKVKLVGCDWLGFHQYEVMGEKANGRQKPRGKNYSNRG